MIASRIEWLVYVGFFSLALAPCAGAAYVDIVLADHPVAYYRLSETTESAAVSDTADDTGVPQQGAQDGSFNNFTDTAVNVAGPRPTAFPGFESDNSAASFDSSRYVAVADTTALQITGALTLEAWINVHNLPGTNGNAGIVAKYVGSGDKRAYNLYIDGQSGSQALGLVISPDGTFSSAAVLTDNVALDEDEWLHVVGTFDPNTAMRLYIDGQQAASTTSGVPSQIANTSADLWLGVQYHLGTTGNFLDGLLDEVAIYNRVLSPSEIEEHYQTGVTIPEPSAAAMLLALFGGLLASRRRA